MPRILYGVSPIGLGHATRALAVLEELRSGAEVRVFSGGKAAQFMAGQGVEVDDIVSDPVPSVAEGEMRRVVLWYLRSWLDLRRTRPRTRRLLEAFAPDLVVCDEEFSGMLEAGRAGVKRVFISDELELGFARTWLARKVESRVEGWYKDLQKSVDLLIVPEAGVDGGNLRHVGPISRRVSLSKEQVLSKYRIPPGRVVLFSMSGSGLGRPLLERARGDVRALAPDAAFVVTGNRGPRLSGDGVYDLGVIPDNHELLAHADLVISTAGKSIIDEADAWGTPLIAVPIRYHAEQERNAAALGYAFEDGFRLRELIPKKLGRRSPPRELKGAEAASRLILSMAQSPGATPAASRPGTSARR
jgi:UDP-N-acetylglucosamine--N-acetylmuramyl-(pentapeptide) pyrophosphoryl-undecaprenol N-acetylglucosamine transferase